MAIIKNAIPILEYDDCESAVIGHDDDKEMVKLPEKAVFAFVGDCIDTYAVQHEARIVEEFVSITKTYPIYVVNFKGEEICLCQAPMGSAPSVQLMDWLIGCGVKKIISAGSCGCLVDLPENTFLVPVKALRDEGASYHYLPPARYVELNREVLGVMEKTLKEKGLPYAECTTWTTDGFFRETRELVAYRREEGCAVVEMECAALASCARFRGVAFGQLLFTADSLANVHEYDTRDFGSASLEKALLLSLDLVAEL